METTIIYIILAIAYFIYQIMKESRKLKEKAQRPDQEFPAPPVQEKPIISEEHKSYEIERPRPSTRTENAPKSFQELMEEFSKGQTPPKEPRSTSPMRKKIEEAVPPRAKTRMEQILDEEKIALEKINADLESAKALSKQRMPLQDEHLQPYQLQKKHKNFYAEYFKNPQNIKTAFVASEIFNKRYF